MAKAGTFVNVMRHMQDNRERNSLVIEATLPTLDGISTIRNEEIQHPFQ